MHYIILVAAAAVLSVDAGVLAPTYPLSYAPAAPIVHYEKTIPYNVPPFATSTSFSARSVYGVPAYAATPVAHSPGPVAQVSALLRTPALEHAPVALPPALPAHHHVAPYSATLPVAHAAPLAASLPVAHSAHLAAPFPVAHAAPLAAALPVPHAAPLPVAHAAPLAAALPVAHAAPLAAPLPVAHATSLHAVKAHHSLTYAPAAYAGLHAAPLYGHH